MTAYCTLSQVMALNANRPPYDQATVPTRAQVEAWMDDIAGEIDAALASRGTTIPVTTPGVFLNSITRLNAIGAAAQAERAAYPDSDEGSNGRRYQDQYDKGIERLLKGEGVPLTAPDSSGARVRARSYGTENPNADGSTSSPIFAITDRF